MGFALNEVGIRGSLRGAKPFLKNQFPLQEEGDRREE